MNRRRFLVLTGFWPAVLATSLRPATCSTTPEFEIYTLFADLATDLSSGDAKNAMKRFDPNMEGYGTLRSNIYALMVQDVVSASIEVLSNEGDAQHRTVQLDWRLVIINQQPTGATVRRREKVTCKLELRKKKWIIVSFAPLDLFKPPAG
jgi:hypothetical protein